MYSSIWAVQWTINFQVVSQRNILPLEDRTLLTIWTLQVACRNRHRWFWKYRWWWWCCSLNPDVRRNTLHYNYWDKLTAFKKTPWPYFTTHAPRFPLVIRQVPLEVTEGTSAWTPIETHPCAPVVFEWAPVKTVAAVLSSKPLRFVSSRGSVTSAWEVEYFVLLDKPRPWRNEIISIGRRQPRELMKIRT